MSNSPPGAKSFWVEAFSWSGAATGRVLPTTVAFGAFAALVSLVYVQGHANLAIEVGPHEVGGVLLSLLLVSRTSAGYDRWWEARKLWGGIVNQSRNLAVAALAHGPADARWRDRVVRWTAAFAYAAKARLRGEARAAELPALLGDADAARVQAAENPPLCVALHVAELLREGCQDHGMDRFAFLQAERERSALVDHLGACERIRNTPLANVYSIAIRRFVFVFLATLPFALLHKFEEEWLAPLVTLLVAYAVLTLDRIGLELQQPFDTRSLSHLPLDAICRNIEKDLLALAGESAGYPAGGGSPDGAAPTSGSGGTRSSPG